MGTLFEKIGTAFILAIKSLKMSSVLQSVLVGVNVYLVFVVWYNVLRNNAYPGNIKYPVKLVHAAILYYLFRSAFRSFTLLFMTQILHPAATIFALTSKPQTGWPILLSGTSSLVLLPICARVMRRERKYLTWLKLFWLIKYSSECYLTLFGLYGEYAISPKAIVFPTVILGAGLFFYHHQAAQIFGFPQSLSGTGSQKENGNDRYPS